MASPSASGEAPADSSETAPKAPVDVSDPPHRIVGAAKDMSEGKKTPEATQSQVDGLTEKAPKIENAQLAGDKDAGEKNMSDLAQFAKHLRDKEGGNQKGDSRVPSVRTISSETQEILDGKSRTAETPSEHPKATDGPVRETHVAMVNDEHNPVAGRQAAVDPAMPLQTSSAIGKAAVSSPGTGMTTTITPTAESFHQDNFHQLVERAMFSVRGGQSEARIALKPDHLGHVQLQILTEHHHVNIKIMTESPVTRDLIDAHAHHLKTELQQQGLNVESIEVSVSDDQRDAYRGARQRESFLRHMTSRGAAEEDETAGRSKPVTGQRQPGRSRANGIDYFA
jgi:flagellar hook-length control protein FliK